MHKRASKNKYDITDQDNWVRKAVHIHVYMEICVHLTTIYLFCSCSQEECHNSTASMLQWVGLCMKH